MIKIGIDPGCSGAIVVLQFGLPLSFDRMPTMQVGKQTRVNGAALAALLPKGADVRAYVEQVGAMPGQGTASMFSFGHACGVVAGVLGALQIPVTLVTPQSWKKRAGLLNSDKDASRSKAIQVWPEWRELDKKGAGQAYADAAFIALFGDSV
jgi:crossover junction endodeoxyribonuclease RuvC